jgi:hypothetical protein
VSQQRDFGQSNQTIIPFTTRMAFLLYDSKQQIIAAFPQHPGPPVYRSCPILCGVITAEDNALVSVRVDSTGWSSSKRYCLSLRPIQPTGNGTLSVGEEKQCFTLSLEYRERHVLTMALARQARPCVVLIASSNGEIQKVNLEEGSHYAPS